MRTIFFPQRPFGGRSRSASFLPHPLPIAMHPTLLFVFGLSIPLAAFAFWRARGAAEGFSADGNGRGAAFSIALLSLTAAVGALGWTGEILNAGFHVARPEAGASLPFARTDLAGEALRYAGTTVKSTAAVRIVTQTLVALIAGGVTSFVAWMVTAGGRSALRGIPFVEGVRLLGGANPNRGAMLAGTAFWMLFTWFVSVGRDWHPLGTSDTGADVALLLLEALWVPMGTALFAAGAVLLLTRSRRRAGLAFAAGAAFEFSAGSAGLLPVGFGALASGLPIWGSLSALAASLLLIALGLALRGRR